MFLAIRLKFMVHGTGRQVPAHGVAKHIALVMPQFSHQSLHLLLLLLLLAENMVTGKAAFPSDHVLSQSQVLKMISPTV